MAENLHAERIARFLSGNLPEAETAALMEWLDSDTANRAYFEEMQALWTLSQQYDKPFPTDVQNAWQRVESKIQTPAVSSKEIKSISIFKYISRIAAIILLLIVAGYGLWYLQKTDMPNEVVIHTGADEMQQIELPDGSDIWLNKNSRISYRPDFIQRVVYLEGEAFFEVEKRDGQPFEIITAISKTVVLGTRFNVRAYDKDEAVEVSVKSGKVAISTQAAESPAVILTAGESGIVDKQSRLAKRQPVAKANADAWKTRRLDFDDVPLKEVIPVLERYFDLDIEVSTPGLLKCHIKGTYENPEFSHIMDVLRFILNVEIEHKNNTYILTGKACE